jgi:hypothetical protein
MIGGTNANLVPFELEVVKAPWAVLARSRWKMVKDLGAVVVEWRTANLVVRVVEKGLGVGMVRD